MTDAHDPGDALAAVARRALSLTALQRPVLIGLDGPVAVGKSALARALAERLRAAGSSTAIVTADGFLLSTAELAGRGLVARKGFPESFDRAGMAAFLRAIRAGEEPSAPSYDHAAYDASPDVRQPTDGAAVVIFEGVNVLGPDLAPLYDLRLYLDAALADVEAWFLKRFVSTPFLPVRAQALAPWRPADGDPSAWGRAVWAAVNRPNLELHIAGSRARADVVLRKAADHSLSAVA